MSLRRISAADAIARLGEFSAVIDARSESEFAEDRLPGAVNWPSLNDAERASIGTEYKQVSPFAARKRGAILVARNIASHVERELLTLERDWRPLIYCWRGGHRSGALSLVLDQIGFSVQVLDGGYREFRRAVVAELETLPDALDLHVVCGATGSGKSRLLGALAAAGAQVLDLEGLACHRGSVLGPVPGMPQPSQKGFETRLWQVLRGFDATRPVFVEGESRTIGRLRVPEHLVDRLRDAPCLAVEMPLDARVALLIEDYAHLVADAEGLCALLARLRELRGAATVERWQQLARGGDFPTLVRELLAEHYDPIYARSTARHYQRFGQAQQLVLADGSAATLAVAAQALAGAPAAPGEER
jgi:tRNA 2-selenouridine synthase